MYRKFFLLLALALPLVAQESPPPVSCVAGTCVGKEDEVAKDKALIALKARIAYLEQRLALTEQKCTALANFYAAQQALDQQKPPEPLKETSK